MFQFEQSKKLEAMEAIAEHERNHVQLEQQKKLDTYGIQICACTSHRIVREIAQKKSPQNHHENLDSL
jgi:arginine repressor